MYSKTKALAWNGKDCMNGSYTVTKISMFVWNICRTDLENVIMSSLAGGYKVSEEPVASIFRFIMLSSLICSK